MTSIELEDIIFTSIVTFIAALQLMFFARSVGKSRKKHNIDYPQMTGDPNFERVLRAQQNTIEFFPLFMICLWLSSLFFNQVASAVVGLMHIYCRHLYFVGYCKSVQDRLPGFKHTVKCMLTMAGMIVAGFAVVLVRMYTDVDYGVKVRAAVGLK